MFSNASGVEVNKRKLEVYFAVMSDQEIQRVTDVNGFKIGTLPFKYLRVPISTMKLKAIDCHVELKESFLYCQRPTC